MENNNSNMIPSKKRRADSSTDTTTTSTQRETTKMIYVEVEHDGILPCRYLIPADAFPPGLHEAIQLASSGKYRGSLSAQQPDERKNSHGDEEPFVEFIRMELVRCLLTLSFGYMGDP